MPPPDKPARRFSFFGLNSAASAAVGAGANVKAPQLKLEADREVYRPGDLITVTIEIKNVSSSWSLLIERLNFEIKGIEKLDTQWFTTPKPSPDSRQRRGHYFCNSVGNLIHLLIDVRVIYFSLKMYVNLWVELIGSCRDKCKLLTMKIEEKSIDVILGLDRGGKLAFGGVWMNFSSLSYSAVEQL